MQQDKNTRAVSRPTVFREPGALLYAGNCQDLLTASRAGKVALSAWTRRGYPGLDLGDALPQICSVGSWDATQPQDWGLREHCNEGVKIAYVARGNMTLTIDGVRHVLSEGRVFVVRPWQLHAYGEPNVSASQLIWVLMDVGVRRPHENWLWPDWLGWPAQDRDRLTQLLSKNEQVSYAASREVSRLFLTMAEIVAGKDIARGEALLRLTISMMLLQFIEMMEREAPVLDLSLAISKRTVEIFLKRLRHALHDDWTLENMAAECNLSRTQFAEHCLLLTNMTPVRYLQTLRLDAAREMLEKRQASVTSIAYDCGFSSSQYFATCYKKRFGFSPLATPC